MLAKLRQFLWTWRGVWITVPTVTGCILLLRWLGFLQLLELAAFDQLIRLRPPDSPDSRIVIVGITETDIQTLGTSILSDADLAQLLTTIKQQKPRAIGLDIVRDQPEGTGQEQLNHVFQTTPNLLGAKKVIANDPNSAIQAPPLLEKQGQIAGVDVVLDPDGKVRRGFLYITSDTDETLPSLGLGLAQLYLKSDTITPQPSSQNPDDLQLGQAVFVPWEANDGGYIRTDAGGYQMMLNYRNSPFTTVSLSDVLANQIPADLMRDRVVLIGYTAPSKKDEFLTPYSSILVGNPQTTYGVLIHAQLTSQIISAAFGERPLIKTWSEPLEWTWILLWSGIGATIRWRWRYAGGVAKFSFPPLLFTLLAGGSLVGICYLAFLQGWWIPLVPPGFALVGSVIAITSYLAHQATTIRYCFSRYLTDEVVANVLENPDALNLEMQRQNVTILMSDLRGFSNISERLPPEQVASLLNIYLSAMTDIINQYKGTINDFIGDAILVFFGAPTQQADDAQRAVACAVAMQLAMSRVNQELNQSGLPKIKMGIGINTGEVVVGNIGSQKRTKWTVIGSPINLASRIESYTVGDQILISEATWQEAGIDGVKICQKKLVQPKGFHQPIPIYDVVGIGGTYDLHLPEVREEIVDLQEEIPIQFTVISGKEIGEERFWGKIFKLSVNGAAIRCEFPLEPLTSLQVYLVNPFGDNQIRGDFYARVSESLVADKTAVWVQFTVMAPDVEGWLRNQMMGIGVNG